MKVVGCVTNCHFEGATPVVDVNLGDDSGYTEVLTNVPVTFKGVPAIVNGQLADAIVASCAARGFTISAVTDLMLFAGLVFRRMRRLGLALVLLLALAVPAPGAINYRATALMDPQTNDQCNYVRYAHTLIFNTPEITLEWGRCADSPPAAGTTGRLLVNGLPGTDWMPLTALGGNKGNGWRTTVPLADGDYCISVQTSDGFPAYTYSVFVGANGPPTGGTRQLCVPPSHFSIDYQLLRPPYNASTVPYTAPVTGTGAPLALPVGLQPWGPAPVAADLWTYDASGFYARDAWLIYDHNLNGETVAAPGRKQCYFFFDLAGAMVPYVPGPRGDNSLCHLVKAKVHPQGGGFYALSVGGGLFRWNTDGSVTCIWSACGPLLNANWPDPREASGAASGDQPICCAWYLDRINWFGQGVNPRSMLRPWGFDAKPSPAPHQIGYHEFLLADTFNGRILKLDHRYAHGPTDPEGPGPDQQTLATVLVTLPGQQPWDVAYEAAYQNASAVVTLRKDPAHGALMRVNDATGAVTTIVRSAIANPDCEKTVKQIGIAQARAQFLRDGAFGVASLVCPNALAFNSVGKLFVVEQVTYALREIDLAAQQIRTVALLQPSGSGREVTLHIDVYGVTGPLDVFWVATWEHNSIARYSATGVLLPNILRNTGTKECVEGPVSVCWDSTRYPWLAAPGNAALPCLLVGSNAQFRLDLVCRKTAAQAALQPPTTLTAAQIAWASGHGTLPALAQTHGQHGDGRLGRPSWAAMAPCTDAQITSYLALTGGLSPTETAAVLSMIRWSTQSNAPRVCGL